MNYGEYNHNQSIYYQEQEQALEYLLEEKREEFGYDSMTALEQVIYEDEFESYLIFHDNADWNTIKATTRYTQWESKHLITE